MTPAESQCEGGDVGYFFAVLDGLAKRGIKPAALSLGCIHATGLAYPPPPKSEDGTPVATPDSDEELLYASANG